MTNISALEVLGLSVRLSGRDILDDITFRVRPGQFVGLIGPNGAGKTTLLRAILGLVKPSRGTIMVAGRSVDHGSSTVGYVPQHIHLDPDAPLRGRDLVGLGIDGHRWGIGWPSRDRRKKIDAVLESVGAREFAEMPVGRLSGGQQQRLLIAHALVSEPELLLLDEPLANLDIKSVNDVVYLVSDMTRTQGIATVLVSHDMNPLLGVMDEVVYLANGKALMGSVDEIVQRDVLSKLYGHHVEVIRAAGRVLVVSGNDQPHHHPVAESRVRVERTSL